MYSQSIIAMKMRIVIQSQLINHLKLCQISHTIE
jgi:hypothetical protein